MDLTYIASFGLINYISLINYLVMSIIYIYEEICLFVFYLKHTISICGGELWGKQYVRESLVLRDLRELRGNRIGGMLRVDGEDPRVKEENLRKKKINFTYFIIFSNYDFLIT